jgi:hypothetical protein
MSKKLYAAFLPLLAVAAFAVMPAVAQAQPHWYSNGVRIAQNKPVTVTTKGTLDFSGAGETFTCKVTDKGTVTNPTGGGAGVDSITEFVNKECVVEPASCAVGETETLVASRGGSPLSATNEWPSTLLAGPPIRDEIREIELKVECNGVIKDVFTGKLTPKFVNGSPVTTCKEATDSFAEFDEPGSGFLEDPVKNHGVPSGKDFIEGPAGDRCITVKNP